jgi:hypothetical protein
MGFIEKLQDPSMTIPQLDTIPFQAPFLVAIWDCGVDFPALSSKKIRIIATLQRFRLNLIADPRFFFYT